MSFSGQATTPIARWGSLVLGWADADSEWKRNALSASVLLYEAVG
jgi:hypothetical protein